MNYEQLVKHIEAFNLLANIPLPYELRKKIVNIINELIETKQKNQEEQEKPYIHFELNDKEIETIETALKKLIISANTQHVIDLLLSEAKKETQANEG
jgi:ribosomal 50S subunit-associated protein YjgA (DUF615 family)